MDANPFINTSIKITDKELYSRFSRILFICLKDNVKHDEEILNPTISDINKLMTNYTILETKNLRLVKNISDKLMIINTSILKKYFDYEFKDEELVIMMYLVNENSLKSYLKQHNGLSNLEEYIRCIYIDKYLDREISSELERINRTNLIKVIDENNFWSLNICKLNITQKFITRNFNYNTQHSNKDMQKIIEDINSKKFNEDYNLNFLEKSNTIDFKESSKIYYTLYYITEHPITNKMSIESFNIIIDYLVHNKYKEEFYYLVMNLLSSKELCHYIINNQHVLQIISEPNIFFKQSFLEKYMPVIKYILGYTWITLYTEESIKKINVSINDRFIFNIETASLLPSFPYNITEPKTSPYLPILVSDSALDFRSNCFPVLPLYSEKYDYGVCTGNTFKKRVSIFFSNTEHDLLEGLDFNGIGITGSCIACCLPNFNPLQLIFNDFNEFANEYYRNADLDIISNLPDFEFIDKAKHIIEVLRTNISNKLGHSITDIEIDSNFIKTIFICVNDNYIKDNFNCSKDEIDFNNIEIKTYFYNIYIENKKKMYNDNIIKYPLEKYKNIYDNVSIDKISITYKPNIYFQYNENIKYKISTPYTKVIEFFQVKANDFFKVLSTFHLPIVRAYYNGSTVYMTPSCISACMTLYNLDIKYFTSTNYPAEIINKYRQRGFGVFLNKNEKLKLMEYSFQIPFWNEKFNIKDKTSIKNILNVYNVKHDFYKNPVLDKDILNYYNYNIYDDVIKESVKSLNSVITFVDHTFFNIEWRRYLYKKYNSIKLKDLDLADMNVIDYRGSIVPLNKNYLIIAYTLL
jgi:hypothetical protein